LLVLLFRLCQGFALGGEVGPTTAFLLEIAPPHRRGLYVALQNATQYLAVLLAGLVGLLLANLLAPDALVRWGWRVAMALGAVTVPFALAIRRRLPETMPQKHAARRAASAGALLRLCLMSLAMLAAATIATYTMNYMSTFAMQSLGVAPARAFYVTALCGACAAAGALGGGMLGDRIGRKPVMIGASLLLLAVALPAFRWIVASHSIAVLLAASAALSVLVGLFVSPAMASLTENMPPAVRAGAVAIVYALAIGIFGGSAQLIVTWLIEVTASPIMPAWYVSGALVVGVAGMIGMPESAPARTP
jgi:MFS family permease